MSQDAIRRYTAACHAMQSGVAMEIEAGKKDTTPKHLRVGVNSALVDSSALAELLITKGLITEDEYHEAIAAGMEREVKTHEQWLSQRLGANVDLA
ncbi:MAG TPA: hypothetical protein VHZ96_11375 [Frankiaceae bacterium]|jgi:hypothetical protein|nr:hypothetical protein [Frankiaceae bacterium]